MIVSFGGYAPACQQAPKEFSKFFAQHFPDEEVVYMSDTTCSTYHKGLEETLEYLRKTIAGHSIVVFVGTSGGGYGALLFGSLLNVTHVIAFIPPTILYRDDKDPRYKNLRPIINSTTRYRVFGDLSIRDPRDCHHIRHCENICVGPNVTLVKMDRVDMKKMRDSGYLLEVFKEVLLSG